MNAPPQNISQLLRNLLNEASTGKMAFLLKELCEGLQEEKVNARDYFCAENGETENVCFTDAFRGLDRRFARELLTRRQTRSI